MSEQRTAKGELIPIDLKGDTVESYMEKLCLKEGYEKIYDTFFETYLEESGGYEKFHLQTDGEQETLYEVKLVDLDGQDIFLAKQEDGGKLSFLVSYWNGGCSLNEALSEAIKNTEK